MSDAGAQRGVLGRALRRFWPIVILLALVGGASASYAALGATVTYTAEARYIVPLAPPRAPLLPGEVPPPPSTLPNDASSAGVLARTYEVVLAQDQTLLQNLSELSGISQGKLQSNARVVAVPGTGVLRVTYTGDSPEEVQSYFANLTTIVSTASPTSNLPTGNVMPLNIPSEVDTVPGLSGAAPVAGLLAGLLLGLAVAVVLERLDARLNGAANLRAIAGWPVFDLTAGNPDTVMDTVVLRVLGSDPTARRVAVVTPPRTSLQVGVSAAADLAAAEARLRRSGALPAGGAPVEWEAFGRLADDGIAERGVQTVGSVVFVTPRRARMRSVTAALNSLQDLGVSDVVALVSGKQSKRLAAAEEGDGPDAGSPAPEHVAPEPVAVGQGGSARQTGPTRPTSTGPVRPTTTPRA